MTPQIDARTFRHVLSHYPTGVATVTALDPERGPVGMVVGSFTSVSLDPPLVAFLPAKSSATWPLIATIGSFCVNILSSDQEQVCRQVSSKEPDRFEGLYSTLSPGGAPLLHNIIAWIDCTVQAVHEAGDHFIVVGQVNAMKKERDEDPLIFLRGSFVWQR